MFADLQRGLGAPIAGWAQRILAAASGDDLGPVDQDPGEVRDRACAILDRPCTPYEPPPPKAPPSFDFSLARVIVAVLLIALLVGLVAIAARFVSRLRSDRLPSPEPEEPAMTSERIIDTSRSPDEWRAVAAEHAAAGRYREALRCRYRALVGDLARGGLLDEIPGRTTGEERAQLADLAPAVSPAFSRASSMFDEVWYGAADVASGDHDRFVAEEHAVLTGVPRRPSATPR